MVRRMFAGRPVIGIAGGIGSGKSFVAAAFAREGCHVIDSDRQVTQAYRDPSVRERLRTWWGDQVITADGEINRSFIASKIFNDLAERRRLEGLIHPRVNAERAKEMTAAMSGTGRKKPPVAFVWDTPLLFETSLNLQCDAVVFVDSPVELRQRRVRKNRGWSESELAAREKSQWPLDRKREISDYVIRNTADAGSVRVQVKDVLSRILAKCEQRA